MHGYYFSRKRLTGRLPKFIGGQLLIEKLGKPDGEKFLTAIERTLVLRCEIENWEIPDIRKKRVLIYFGRMWELCFGLDESFKPVPKWVLIEPKLNSGYLDISYRFYYIQHRKRRIKFLTTDNEVCRLYQESDPSNVHWEEEVLPCYQKSTSPLGPKD